MRHDHGPAGESSLGWARVRLAIFLGFLAICFLGGGASRYDVWSLLYLRPAAVFCAAFLLLVPGPLNWARVRGPLIFLGALVLIMIVQLIPLPPELWTSLPGHGRFAEAATAAGLPQPWRPISISPDLTLNSMVSLVVPATVLIGMASIGSQGSERLLLLFLLCAIVGSGVLGIAQVTGGGGSSLYFYRITNDGLPVGFFANRNHQAALLACGFPALAAWACARTENPVADRARYWVAGLVGAMLIPLIVVTGSRSGVILGAIGLAAASFTFWATRSSRISNARAALWALLPWLIGFGLLLLSLLVSSAPAIQRVLQGAIAEDQRVQDFDLFVGMARDFLPFGSGFGTFDPLFRVYEPYDHLRFTYLNHAHNDLMELIITAGLFGAGLLAAFLIWWLRKSLPLLRATSRGGGASLRILGSAVVLILMVASLLDYPLRTPIMMALLAIAATWLASGRISRQPANRDGR